MIDHDATGIEPTTGGQTKLFPKGWYNFEIVSFQSQAGDVYPMEGLTKEKKYPKVDFLAEVVDNQEFKGERVFHNVTFIPKGKDGAGMSIHFLKTIQQPYEGKLQVNTDDWVGQRFTGYVNTDEYNGKKKNKIIEVKVYEPKNDGVPY